MSIKRSISLLHLILKWIALIFMKNPLSLKVSQKWKALKCQRTTLNKFFKYKRLLSCPKIAHSAKYISTIKSKIMDSKISKEIAAYQQSKASALYQNKLTRETNKLLI